MNISPPYRRPLLLALLLLGLTPADVRAQTPLPGETTGARLELDLPVTGTLTDTAYAAVHPFAAAAGQELSITARSRDFDTVLEVGRVEGNAFVVYESDDDGAGGTDSRVYFTASATGVYTARVTSYGGGSGGGYTILLSPPPDLPAPADLPPGRPTAGALTATSPTSDDGAHFQDFVFRSEGRERFRIEARSDELDTVLRVGYLEGRRFVELGANDDAGVPELGVTDSRVDFLARAAGEYIARVSAYGTGERGRFTLLATSLGPVRTDPRGGAIAPGATQSGVLDEGDAVLDDGTAFQEWSFRAAAGDRLEVRAESAAFDTYVMVGRDTPSGFEELAYNDDWPDSANRTDSRLVFPVPATGEYRIRIRPFAAGGGGAYTLSLVPAPPVRTEARGGSLRAGESVSGTLMDDEARLEGDLPHQEWRVPATAGDRLTIELLSTDFDTFLSVGRVSAGRFVEIDSDDDGGDGTDSRVVLVVHETGEYTVRVRPFQPDGRGGYTLRVSRSDGG